MGVVLSALRRAVRTAGRTRPPRDWSVQRLESRVLLSGAFAANGPSGDAAFLAAAPPPEADRFEPNESFAEARGIGSAGHLVLDGLTFHAPGDQDHFRFTALRPGTLKVAAWFEGSSSTDVSLSVYNPDGSPENSAVVAAGQDYYLRVSDAGGVTVSDYSLSVEIESNARPWVAIFGPGGLQKGDLPIDYLLFDADSDPCAVLVEYSVDNGNTWLAATAGPGGDGTTGLSSSGAGTRHSFVWDTTADLGTTYTTGVRVRITPGDPDEAGSPTISTRFPVDNLLNHPPAGVWLTPDEAADNPGTFRTFTAEYQDTEGAADIDIAYLRVLNASTGRALVAVYYGPTNKLYLVAEDGVTLLGGFAPGSANTISNSLGILDAASTTLSRADDILTVDWRLSAGEPLIGANTLQLLSRDHSFAWSTWTTHGSWFVVNPANSPPTGAGITPGSGLDNVDVFRTFTAQYRDPNGASDIDIAYLRVANASSGATLTAVYYGPTNRLYLVAEDGSTLLGGFTPGSANTLTNTRGTLNVANTSVSRSGDTMTVHWSVSAKAPLVGANSLQLLSRDHFFAWSAWTTHGSWSVLNHANSAPAGVGITPNPASDAAGTFRAFTARYRDADGAADIDIAYLRVANSSTGQALTAVYYGPTNRLYLVAEDGVTLLGGFAPGSANTISNSLGTLDVAATTLSRSGDTLTVNWSLSPKATLAGANSLQLLARDRSFAWSPLTAFGTWTIG
jgi:hypothetical protein